MFNVCRPALPLVFLWLMAVPAAAGVKVAVSSGEIHMAGQVGATTAAASGTAQDAGRSVLFFPSVSDPLGRQGFVRVVNQSNRGGSVSITAFDDAGRSHGPVTLTLDALQTVHFNSTDLEDGNAGKGLPTGVGRPTEGDWRLELASELNVKVLSYIRTSDGFVTSMHDVVPSDSGVHRVAFFNPGSNYRQESLLRMVNPGDSAASVSIRGVDDEGVASGTVRLSIPPRAARTASAAELEDQALGDGMGKWRLEVEADVPVHVMSLLATPTGHITNLSTDPGDDTSTAFALSAPTLWASDTELLMAWIWDYREGDSDVFDTQVRPHGGSWQVFCEDYGGGASGLYTYRDSFENLNPDTTYDVRYRYRPSGSCASGTPDTWSGVASARTQGGSGSSQAPDLVVESPAVDDATPAAGSSFTFKATVRNRGDGSADATTLRYYRSSNATISTGDTQVGTDSVSGLSAGASGSESISLTAPSSAGTYYYGACVDSVAGESNTANNCSDGVRVDVSGSGGGGGGGGRAGECVEGDTYDPGEGCDVYGTGGSSSKERFEVLSDGRGRFGFFTAGNSISNPGGSINGVRYHFVASHQGGGTWKVDEYRP